MNPGSISKKVLIALASVLIGYSSIKAEEKFLVNGDSVVCSKQDYIFNKAMHELNDTLNVFTDGAKAVLKDNFYCSQDLGDTICGHYFPMEDGDMVLINGDKFLREKENKRSKLENVMAKVGEYHGKNEQVPQSLMDSLDLAVYEWMNTPTELAIRTLNHENLHDIWHKFLTKDEKNTLLSYAKEKYELYNSDSIGENEKRMLGKCCDNPSNSIGFEEFLFTEIASKYDANHFLEREVFPYLGEFAIADPSLIPEKLAPIFARVFKPKYSTTVAKISE